MQDRGHEPRNVGLLEAGKKIRNRFSSVVPGRTHLAESLTLGFLKKEDGPDNQ